MSDKQLYVVVEANHLYKATQRFDKKIFVSDVVRFAVRNFMGNRKTASIHIIYGSAKHNTGDNNFTQAMHRDGYQTHLMPVINDNGREYFDSYKALEDILIKMPKGSDVFVIGFHHNKFIPIFEAARKAFDVYLAAFSTRSQNGGLVTIRGELKDVVKNFYYLDMFVDNIVPAKFRGNLPLRVSQV